MTYHQSRAPRAAAARETQSTKCFVFSSDRAAHFHVDGCEIAQLSVNKTPFGSERAKLRPNVAAAVQPPSWKVIMPSIETGVAFDDPPDVPAGAVKDVTAVSRLSSTNNTSASWYAVRVRSRFEATTSTCLRSKGFEEFLPTYRSSRKWSDRIKPLDMPLFPGYVFCRFRLADLYNVLNTSGVVHIVSTGNKPNPVDEKEIASVRKICAAGLPALPWTDVTEGQRLVVSRGPLKGAEGIVVEVRDHFRLVAAISLLQRAVAIELEREWITPVVS